jgi:hypothetical protein
VEEEVLYGDGFGDLGSWRVVLGGVFSFFAGKRGKGEKKRREGEREMGKRREGRRNRRKKKYNTNTKAPARNKPNFIRNQAAKTVPPFGTPFGTPNGHRH